jgi:hypothetical protein
LTPAHILEAEKRALNPEMKKPIRVEITGRNSFWQNAVKVEWEHQYPERPWIEQGDRYYVIEADWLADLQRVANQCFSTAVIAPEDVGKRQLFRTLFRAAEDDE